MSARIARKTKAAQSARKRATAGRRASPEQLRGLAARLQAMREEERASIAREIHDVLAQDLTRIKIDLVWLHGRLTRPSTIKSTSALAARVLEMSKMADETIRSVQQIATHLRPAVLDSLGLSAAVEWHVQDFQTRTGVACYVDVPVDIQHLDPDVATAAFRILQESLTNVLRHARATRVDVLLRQEDDQIVLTVHDNGCGAPPHVLTSPAAIGIAGMRERATLAGGEFEFSSLAGSGTTVVARLPRSKNGKPAERVE